MLLTSCSCSTAGRELATWTGTHVGSGTKAIATWIPANCWREEEEEDSLLNWFNGSQWFMIKQTETEISHAYLLYSPLGFGIKEDLRMEELTNNTLVPSWQSLPAGTAVWMEARATHIGPDRDKKEKNKQTHYSPRPPKTYFSITPQQIHKVTHYFLSWPESCMASAFRINKTNFDTKPPRVMDGGISREGRRGRKCEGAHDMRSSISFSFKAEFKLGRAGCIKVLLSPKFHAWLSCSLANIQQCPPPLAHSALILTSGERVVTFDPVWQM